MHELGVQTCIERSQDEIERERDRELSRPKKALELLAISISPGPRIEPQQDGCLHRVASRRTAASVTLRIDSTAFESAVSPAAVSEYGRREPSVSEGRI